jgi:hypothetical protein
MIANEGVNRALHCRVSLGFDGALIRPIFPVECKETLGVLADQGNHHVGRLIKLSLRIEAALNFGALGAKQPVLASNAIGDKLLGRPWSDFLLRTCIFLGNS